MDICNVILHSIVSSSDADSLVEYYALEIAANDTRADCDDLLSLNVTIQPVRC